MSDYILLLGDCLEEMSQIEAGSVDAIIADLPYGKTEAPWDAIIPLEPLWEQCKRVIKPRGVILFFSAQPFTSALIMSNLAWFKYEWIWEKTIATDFLNGRNKPLRAHENIVVFSSGMVANRSPNLMTYNPQIDYSRGGWKKIQRSDPRKIGHNVWGGQGRQPFEMDVERGNDGHLPRSVIKFANPNHNNSHPTQKPVTLLEYLVLTYTNPGELVLDCTFGSCTTGVACLKTGRRFIGIEKDPGYFEIGKQRMEAEAAKLNHTDLPLFAGVAND